MFTAGMCLATWKRIKNALFYLYTKNEWNDWPETVNVIINYRSVEVASWNVGTHTRAKKNAEINKRKIIWTKAKTAFRVRAVVDERLADQPARFLSRRFVAQQTHYKYLYIYTKYICTCFCMYYVQKC